MLALSAIFACTTASYGDTTSSALSQMEAIAFGQSQTGEDEQRLAALEKKAYGVVRKGTLSQRIAAMQHFMGVAPQGQESEREHINVRLAPTGSDSIENPTSKGGNDINATPQRQPLEATVSSRQIKLEAGDDARFGGAWVGTLSSKIDPHVKVYCELHGSGSHFTGTMIWTSAVCGGCRRTIVGFFDAKNQACMMKDLYVEALNTRQAVKFCKVERYAFGITESAQRLSGWFHSSECKDEGAVTLTRYREQQ